MTGLRDTSNEYHQRFYKAEAEYLRWSTARRRIRTSNQEVHLAICSVAAPRSLRIVSQ